MCLIVSMFQLFYLFTWRRRVMYSKSALQSRSEVYTTTCLSRTYPTLSLLYSYCYSGDNSMKSFPKQLIEFQIHHEIKPPWTYSQRTSSYHVAPSMVKSMVKITKLALFYRFLFINNCSVNKIIQALLMHNHECR